MVKLYEKGAFLLNGTEIIDENDVEQVKAKLDGVTKEDAKKGTIAYGILEAHNQGDDLENLNIKFDALTSHDITFVGIIQTARASGMEKFPVPYILTNCHNSLSAVGGTINEDDHVFGLTAAKKYGGIYVPPHMAVIHQFMREEYAGCGKMILGSDSHTRYGALGTMAIGEGGGELVKQILEDTYDIKYPGVVGIYLDNKPNPGVGPQDIALAIIGEVFKNGYVKNKVMEFVGPGVSNLKTDFRNGVDVMTTETTCLTSIWRTDEDTKEFLKTHNREDEYKELNPEKVAYYDGMVYVDLSKVKPMIALPFHPSNTYTIDELNANLEDILRTVELEAQRITDNPNIDFDLLSKIKDNKLYVQQAIIAGCAGGTYSNIMEAANILKGHSTGNEEFALSVYPSSQPIFMELIKNGTMNDLMASGAAVKTAFCGPCFGAGDTPANNSLSIRHTTRNFPNREGSKPIQGQMSGVALMDARSIAATARNKGILTSAEVYAEEYELPKYSYDDSAYRSKVYNGFKNENSESELIYGPNIKDWPEMPELTDNILLKVCSKILDPVTTTDELIPSGETSSYRSNPLGLAEFTLSRRDPEYVGRSKVVNELEKSRQNGDLELDDKLKEVYDKISEKFGEIDPNKTEIGSMIYAIKPGDGSAREQAASCQRVLGGLANICKEYATKRYRSNVINWGMIPFQMKEDAEFEVGDYIFVPGIRDAIDNNLDDIKAYVIGDEIKEISLYIEPLTDNEKEIIKEGSLINFNRNK
ncbi:hydratase [Peptoniphilus sp. MSJ-1]|uniref:Hydratase n=1 Tax=Peptoniphilus ovalis TaxID=2841503 RepID=A0ABS6FG56_9FIRM|nr:hydratase [Peptoniphilus ovalis]MBU5669162.1 hydratase [Peptoniphilus ovalis]